MPRQRRSLLLKALPVGMRPVPIFGSFRAFFGADCAAAGVSSSSPSASASALASADTTASGEPSGAGGAAGGSSSASSGAGTGDEEGLGTAAEAAGSIGV